MYKRHSTDVWMSQNDTYKNNNEVAAKSINHVIFF